MREYPCSTLLELTRDCAVRYRTVGELRSGSSKACSCGQVGHAGDGGGKGEGVPSELATIRRPPPGTTCVGSTQPTPSWPTRLVAS